MISARRCSKSQFENLENTSKTGIPGMGSASLPTLAALSKPKKMSKGTEVSTRKDRPKRGFTYWGTWLSIILAAVGIILVVMEQYGHTIPGILPRVMEWSRVWLPILCGIAGFFIGWDIHDRKAKRDYEGLKAEHAAELTMIEENLGMSFEDAALKLNKLTQRDKRKEVLRARMLDFPLEYKAILFSAIEYETVTLFGSEKKVGASLVDDGLMVQLNNVENGGVVFKCSDLAREIIHPEDHDLWGDLRDAKLDMYPVLVQRLLDVKEKHFRNLNFEQKTAIYKALKNGFVEYDVVSDISGRINACKFLIGEDIGNDVTRYTVNPEYMDLLEARGDALFATVIESLAQDDGSGNPTD